MKRVLIINIDPTHRSIYTAYVASLYLKANPAVKITLITSLGNEALTTTEIFENIHFINTEKFFHESKNFSNDTTEREVKKCLAPVLNTEWEMVVNLSSNPFGSMLTHFLRGQVYLGSYLDSDFSLEHSGFDSYLLSELPEGHNNYFHFNYLFQSILNMRSESFAFSSLSSNQGKSEVQEKLDQLKEQEGKSQIILIDTSMRRSGALVNFNFLIDLYVAIIQEGKYLPILFSSNSQEDSFLINRLRELVEGEIYLLSSEKPALLDLLQGVSMLITDDLNMKALADLSMKPSLLLHWGVNIPVSDFSIHEKSLLLLNNEVTKELSSQVVELYRYLLENKPVASPACADVYRTHLYHNVPLLIPLNEGQARSRSDVEYAHWLLGFRYLAKLEDVNVPMMKVESSVYNTVIENERDLIKQSFSKFLNLIKSDEQNFADKFKTLESNEGLLSLGIKWLNFKNGGSSKVDARKLLEQLRSLLKGMLDFLGEEEKPKEYLSIL